MHTVFVIQFNSLTTANNIYFFYLNHFNIFGYVLNQLAIYANIISGKVNKYFFTVEITKLK
jgi:hypothetical protein